MSTENADYELNNNEKCEEQGHNYRQRNTQT